MNTDMKGPIAWMTRNHVAANLLMLVFLLGGIIMLATSVRQEVFPEFQVSVVNISVPYPGASPEEVESGIVLAVEEAIEGIEGIKEVTSTASENLALVSAELYSDADRSKAAGDIRNAVDRITTFPGDAEDPVVEVPTTEHEVLQLVLYGDIGEHALKELAESARDDLLAYEDVTRVDVSNTRPLEIGIEVPQDRLRAYGLTIEDVAAVIRNTAVELPGGELKTEGGKVLLRTMERRDWAREFADITVVSSPGGSRVSLGDIAVITEGFEDVEQFAYFDGKPAVRLQVYRTGDQTPMEVADAVKAYRESVAGELPPGVGTTVIADMSEIYYDRVDLLVKNGLIGLSLVLVFLGIFLQPSLAFWVSMGIPISFLGTLLFLPGFDVSINMISLFAYIVTLGIVVDDAIVVGENIHEHRLRGDDPVKSSITGAREVAVPVVFSVLTSAAAFSPLLFVSGDWGKVMWNIPVVVILVLMISLAESLFILPAHLSRIRANNSHTGPGRNPLVRFQRGMSRGIVTFSEKVYSPVLAWCVHNRWVTFTVAAAVLIIAVGFIRGGRVPIVLMPSADADWVNVEAELPFDAPLKDTQKVRAIIEQASEQVLRAHPVDTISEGLITMITDASHLRFTQILTPADERNMSIQEFTDAWREAAGEIPGLESLRFETAQVGPHGGRPLQIQLSHRSIDVLETAGARLARELAGYKDIIDIDDGFTEGKPQMDFHILPEGRALGLTPVEIGRQVRHAVYGMEALEQQRGRDTVSVMVRLPHHERMSEQAIRDFMIRLPGGGEVPLSHVVGISDGSSYTSITRVDGKRTVTVSADLALGGTADLSKVVGALKEKELPDLMQAFPGLTFEVAGEQKEGGEALSSLFTGFLIALLVMYCMVAIPFKSYTQALIVLIAIPFGFVGALIGHFLLGYPVSLMSMFGLVALSGVVINDSIVLIHKANSLRSEGMDIREAVEKAGVRRMRPILLTSLTTFLGLAPMIFETSFQARFLIPMALSLGFGVLFATLVTLLLVPALYVIQKDVKDLLRETAADIWRMIGRTAGGSSE